MIDRGRQGRNKKEKVILGLALFCLVCAVMNLLHINDRCIHVVEGLVFIVFTVGLYIIGKEEKLSRWFLAIIAVGYGARICYMLINIYTPYEFIIPYGAADGNIFYLYAKEMYLTGNNAYYTYYPYVVLAVFKTFGLSRLIAQYLNIVCYVISCMVLLKIFGKLYIKESIQKLGLYIFALFPNYIFVSSLLMRESLIIFCVLCSFLLWLYWKEEGKAWQWIGTILILAPASVLHSGVSILAIGYILVFLCYDRKERQIKFGKKLVIGGVAVIVGLVILWLTPLRYYLFSYLVLSWEDIIRVIEERNRQIAGANYLTHQEINGPWDLLIYLPMRMLYFQMSPMPWNWRGITDAVAFIIDSGTYIIALFCVISMLIKKKKDRIIPGLIGLQMILFAAMHGWGVMNAGTAMRHRCKLLGLAVIAIVYYLQNRKLPENEQG